MSARLVLYVEDDDASFSLARILLEEEEPSVQLLRARDGDQALAILRKAPPYEDAPTPDLVILDLNLPRKTGFEILSDLRATENLRRIPVVIFSTSSLGADKMDSLARGADAFITKGANLDPFIEALRTACSFARGASGGGSR